MILSKCTLGRFCFQMRSVLFISISQSINRWCERRHNLVLSFCDTCRDRILQKAKFGRIKCYFEDFSIDNVCNYCLKLFSLIDSYFYKTCFNIEELAMDFDSRNNVNKCRSLYLLFSFFIVDRRMKMLLKNSWL